jgi:hypothetical protein
MINETYKCKKCLGCQAMEGENWQPIANCENFVSGEGEKKKLPECVQVSIDTYLKSDDKFRR